MLLGDKPTPGAALDHRLKTAFAELHVLKPGRIMDYDPVEQMADVLPLFAFMPAGGGVTVPYPLLHGVRVLHPGTDTAYIRFPIRSDVKHGAGNGTEVALLFADGALDRYFEMAQGQPPVDTQDVRAHALTDAVAILGLRPDRLVIMPGYGGNDDLEMTVATEAGSPLCSMVMTPGGAVSIYAGTASVFASKIQLRSKGDGDYLCDGDLNCDASGGSATFKGDNGALIDGGGANVDLTADGKINLGQNPADGVMGASVNVKSLADAFATALMGALATALPPITNVPAVVTAAQTALESALETILIVSTKTKVAAE